jgi:hypothetical protein
MTTLARTDSTGAALGPGDAGRELALALRGHRRAAASKVIAGEHTDAPPPPPPPPPPHEPYSMDQVVDAIDHLIRTSAEARSRSVARPLAGLSC